MEFFGCLCLVQQSLKQKTSCWRFNLHNRSFNWKQAVLSRMLWLNIYIYTFVIAKFYSIYKYIYIYTVYILTLSHPDALAWRVKSSGIKQSKITKEMASLREKGLSKRWVDRQSFSWAKQHACCKSHVWTILIYINIYIYTGIY